MPRGYPKTGRPAGAAVKRFFVGMRRTCKHGHAFDITEAMDRNGSYKCPQCASAYAVEYARSNRDKKRAWNSAYLKRNPEVVVRHTRAYRERYPQKNAARQAVQTALRNGSLVKQPCSVCGAAKSHAHHDDYTKPLGVEWLCHLHHMERHQILAERERAK